MSNVKNAQALAAAAKASDYEWGFSSDIEQEVAPKRLSEHTARFTSATNNVFSPTARALNTRQLKNAMPPSINGAGIESVVVGTPSNRSVTCGRFPAKRAESSSCAADRIVTANSPDFSTSSCVWVSLFNVTHTSGGSSEMDVNELTVMP